MVTPRRDHLLIQAAARADHRWRSGVIDWIDNDRVKVSYLHGGHAVVRVLEPVLGPPPQVAEIHEVMGFGLLGSRVYRVELVMSTAPSSPPPRPSRLTPFIAASGDS